MVQILRVTLLHSIQLYMYLQKYDQEINGTFSFTKIKLCNSEVFQLIFYVYAILILFLVATLIIENQIHFLLLSIRYLH